MAEGVVTPKVPDKGDIILGDGIFYYDWRNNGTSNSIGATRGGSTFEVEREFKEIEYDGQNGPTKGLRRKTRVAAKFTLNLLSINWTNLAYGQGITVTDEGAYHKVIEDMEIVDGDYAPDITFIGQTHEGNYVRIILDDALMDNTNNLPLNSKDEVVTELTYTGHFDPTTPLTIPYEQNFED